MSQTDPNQSLAADEAQRLLVDLRESLATAAEDIGPRFLDIMPLSYFQDTPHEERLTHLRAILAARASGRLPSLDLRDGKTGSRSSGPMTIPDSWPKWWDNSLTIAL